MMCPGLQPLPSCCEVKLFFRLKSGRRRVREKQKTTKPAVAGTLGLHVDLKLSSFALRNVWFHTMAQVSTLHTVCP